MKVLLFLKAPERFFFCVRCPFSLQLELHCRWMNRSLYWLLFIHKLKHSLHCLLCFVIEHRSDCYWSLTGFIQERKGVSILMLISHSAPTAAAANGRWESWAALTDLLSRAAHEAGGSREAGKLAIEWEPQGTGGGVRTGVQGQRKK